MDFSGCVGYLVKNKYLGSHVKTWKLKKYLQMNM